MDSRECSHARLARDNREGEGWLIRLMAVVVVQVTVFRALFFLGAVRKNNTSHREKHTRTQALTRPARLLCVGWPRTSPVTRKAQQSSTVQSRMHNTRREWREKTLHADRASERVG
ncbi:hypothetical protein BCV70DRAFT_85903 [Testicularia cyperi]|uniref:Uncharacterized protein n=1 Tax=Testicularia cyperi TaxID=1882483 RepID=A0A317XSS3_9BASI|nr:hypothetical protein BCV70DRAFT_85903 [Testicularia cyperi]